LTGQTGGGLGSQPPKSKALDLLSVIGVAILLVAVFEGGALLARTHGVSNFWVSAGMMAGTFALLLGWTARSLFKRPRFVPYFVALVAAEAGGYALLAERYRALIPLPPMLTGFLLFLAGYFLTFLIFGVPPEAKGKK